MTIHVHPYSAIITKGLGAAACCSVITMDFGLLVCNIDVPSTPASATNSGGGPYPKPSSTKWSRANTQNWMTPVNGQMPIVSQHVMVTIKFGDNTFKRHYSIDKRRTQYIIKAANIVASTKARFTMTVESVKRVVNKVKVRLLDK